MIDASIAMFLSFRTDRSDDPNAIRLQIASALETAGADIDTTMNPHEVDWLFYGTRDGLQFTVVLVQVAAHSWFTFLEGSTAEEQPSPSIRAWAHPIIESTLRSRDGTGEFRWHESNLTLPKP